MVDEQVRSQLLSKIKETKWWKLLSFTWPRWRCPSAARCLRESACRCLPCVIPPTLPYHQCHQYEKQTLSLQCTDATNLRSKPFQFTNDATNLRCNDLLKPESNLRCLTRSAKLCPRRSVSKCQGKSVNLGPSRFAKRWLRLFMVSPSTTIKMLTAHWPIST